MKNVKARSKTADNTASWLLVNGRGKRGGQVGGRGGGWEGLGGVGGGGGDAQLRHTQIHVFVVCFVLVFLFSFFVCLLN